MGKKNTKTNTSLLKEDAKKEKEEQSTS